MHSLWHPVGQRAARHGFDGLFPFAITQESGGIQLWIAAWVPNQTLASGGEFVGSSKEFNMASGYQVIKFFMVDFGIGWTRDLYPNQVVSYKTTKEGGNLAVVSEGAKGVMTTYRFVLSGKNEVLIVEGAIHIPSHCLEQEPGNTITCERID